MYVNAAAAGRVQSSIGVSARTRVGNRRTVTLDELSEQMESLAGQFSAYLTDQTGVVLESPRPGDRDSLRRSFERLDLALGQVADMASVYGSEQRSDIEPLTLPTAVLAGEYLRIGLHGRWMEPAYEGDTNLMLVTGGGVALDMDGMARTALLSPQPNLTAFIEKLLRA